MSLLFDWDLGNGMNLFIYYTSNLWHSLRGLQDRFTTIIHHSIDVRYTLDLEFYRLEGHNSAPHTSLLSPELYTACGIQKEQKDAKLVYVRVDLAKYNAFMSTSPYLSSIKVPNT
jgi:hypothetical protein